MPFSLNKTDRFVTTSLGFLFAFGVLLLGVYFTEPSESGNQFLFGLSVARLLVGVVFAVLVSMAGMILISLFRPILWVRRVWERSNRVLETRNRLYFCLTILYGLVLTLGALLILGLLPSVKNTGLVVGIIQRLQYPILWLIVTVLISGFLILHVHKQIFSANGFSPLTIALWIWMFLCDYILLVTYYRKAAYASYLNDFEFPLIWLGIYFLLWALISKFPVRSVLREKINQTLLLVGIFFTVFVLYQQLAIWAGWVNQSRYEYWDSLAQQFLNGKLYIADGSVTNFTTHDLTLYNGKWYVPIPPLPAILMMPVMLFAKPENVSMGNFSMLVGGLNSVLLYLILTRLTTRQWVMVSRTAIFLLVLLFSFGTNHLWVSIMGDVWFVSQMVTVTFLALAVLGALWEASPWVVGALLGIAMLARPNSLMTWPFVFAIAMQIKKDDGTVINFRQMLGWAVRSSLPIGLAILGLLFYNQARFGNFFDFGYVTISGEATIVKNAQTYGLFSPHYILHNLKVMFIQLPQLRTDGRWMLVPSLEGMSMLLSTPALIYLFRRYDKKWWVLGAWLSIILGFFLLMMYHNTGAAQFGYRYILDVLIPIIALLSLSFQRKIPWHFYILLLCSVAMNIYGTIWFINAS